MTDFASASKPSLPTCSLRDMTAVSADDIITKLKMLFLVVTILFGFMNLGAAAGFALDRRKRIDFIQCMQTNEVGFRMGPKGEWLWSFSLDPLRGELDAPTGPAVSLSALLGIPLVRLRAALPDELLVWDLATAMGRKHVCSVSRSNSSLRELNNLLPPLFGSRLSKGSARNSEVSVGRGNGSIASARNSSSQQLLMEEFVGTALVLAFVQVAQLLPVQELATLVSAAAAYFQATTTPFGRDFSSTQTDFVTMISPGILNGESRWLQRAQLFKLILSQRADGSFAVSSTTAFALEARPVAETKQVTRKLMSCMNVFAGVVDEVEEVAGPDGDLPVSGRSSSGAIDDISMDNTQELELAEMDVVQDAHPDLNDCPLTCPAEAITESMPRALRALSPDAQSARVWCTLCCIAVLERMNTSWIAGDGDLYEPQEKTIVDSAYEWVAFMTDAQPELAAALEEGAVLKKAQWVTKKWHLAFEQRVDDLRRAEAVRSQLPRRHIQRLFTNLTRAVVTKHSTMATFLSEPLDGLQRWQMFMIIVTLCLSQLLVNIWVRICVRRTRASQLALLAAPDVLCQGGQLLCPGGVYPGLWSRRRQLPVRRQLSWL